MWITCLSAPQNAKNEHQLEHKNRVRNWRYFVCVHRVWKIILDIRGWAHENQNFNKNIEKVKNFFTCNRVLKHKAVVSNQQFLLMSSWKCVLHIYVTFLQESQPPLIRNKFIYFFIINNWMYNNHLSASWRAKNIELPNIKGKVSFKITLGYRHVYIWHMLTFYTYI